MKNYWSITCISQKHTHHSRFCSRKIHQGLWSDPIHPSIASIPSTIHSPVCSRFVVARRSSPVRSESGVPKIENARNHFFLPPLHCIHIIVCLHRRWLRRCSPSTQVQRFEMYDVGIHTPYSDFQMRRPISNNIFFRIIRTGDISIYNIATFLRIRLIALYTFCHLNSYHEYNTDLNTIRLYSGVMRVCACLASLFSFFRIRFFIFHCCLFQTLTRPLRPCFAPRNVLIFLM